MRGWLLVFLGSALALGMTALSFYLAATILNKEPGGARWTGTHDFTVRVFAMFGSIFVFGLVAIGGGIYQLRTGRVSKIALVLLLGVVLVMLFLGQSIMNEPAAPRP